MKQTQPLKLWPFFILSFIVWIYCFRGFISGKLSLSSDALAYFEHFKFYIDQISRGVYPQWDPTRDGGVPIEFFLRRIGSHNPLFLLIIIFEKCGLTFLQAYLGFLVFYFFLGAIGFFLTAKLFFKDSFYAFISFLLLLFSSLGTRLFDSYIILTFTPMVWFFYFLLNVIQLLSSDQDNVQKIKINLIGCLFTLMVLFNTYLPFYFLTVLLTFVIAGCAVYWRNLAIVFKNLYRFASCHKVFICVWLCILFISFIPGWIFFQEMKKGEFVLPLRQPPGLSQSSLEVDPIWVTKWGIEEDIVYSSAYLSDLRRFKFAVFYLPVFAYLLFFSGMFLKFNRRLVLLFIWILMLFMISAQQLPFYQFLKTHINFFKYFRNLHFFLWFSLLPIFIVFVVEQLKVLKEQWPTEKIQRILWNGMIIGIHITFLIYILTQTKPIIFTFVSIGLSLIFLLGYLSGRPTNQFWLYSAVLLAIIFEAVQVFQFLPVNSGVLKTHSYRYEKPYVKLILPDSQEWSADKEILQSIKSKTNPPSIYMGLKWYNFLNQIIPQENLILQRYIDKKFLIYDRTEALDLKKIDLQNLLKTIVLGTNMALVTAQPGEEKILSALNKLDSHLNEEKNKTKVQIVTKDYGQLEVLNYDVNNLKFKTDFNSMKFVVYNDGYASGWRGFIDGKPLNIWRANLAFKGMWIPEGKHVIELKYGSTGQYWFNYGLLILFLGVFIYLLNGLFKIQYR